MTNQKKELTIVIDGACSGNPGPGGWACVLRFGGHQREFTVSSTKPRTTGWNSKLRSAVFGLKEACRVTVITDSQYVQRGMPAALEAERLVEKQSRPGAQSRSLGTTRSHDTAA